MSRLRTPAILFALLYVFFLADVLITAPSLPDRPATHFDAAGHANGWMTRWQHAATEIALGTGMSLLFIGISYSIRFFPASLVNIPHRDYWLAPERRAGTNQRLFTTSFWLAGLIVLFFGGIHHLILAANAASPPRLPTTAGGILVAGFLAGIGIWIVALCRQFPRPE